MIAAALQLPHGGSSARPDHLVFPALLVEFFGIVVRPMGSAGQSRILQTLRLGRAGGPSMPIGRTASRRLGMAASNPRA